ncbi:luciferin sulfotransferase-like isoform X1 [Schistocerca gregaria]|uniref:luciferin sulfotransferase-like isoform X1 n=1 Tax=Schistocerca gregaria TaxID=7010 RepID=UPI00211E12C0|nr:luciferin sulfotransferase-like isoform X1 [Schistocerca gregaria]
MWTTFKYEPFKDENFDYVAENGSDVFSQGVIRVSPSECVLPAAYMEIALKIKNFKVYEDDIWVVSFPKCGSSLTREMVWLLMKDLDFQTARNVDLVDRFPCLEFNSILLRIPEVSYAVDLCDRMERPRFIMSHLPVELLPDGLWTVKPKIIYVSRNPKDTAVSLYNHYKLTSHYSGTMEGFMNAFLGNVIFYTPYWNHVLGFWRKRGESHLLFNTVEEMKQCLQDIIKRTADFLGKRVTDQEVNMLMEHLETFQSLRRFTGLQIAASGEDPSGTANDDADGRLTPEMLARFDRWNEESLQGTGYTGPV